jgi:hypothetical protein
VCGLTKVVTIKSIVSYSETIAKKLCLKYTKPLKELKQTLKSNKLLNCKITKTYP